MHTRWFKRLGAPLALGASLLSGCGDGGTSAGRGTLSLAITDAPFPYGEVASVDIFVVRIDAKQEEASESEVADGAAESHEDGERHRRGGWVTVATPNRSINLFALQNGTTMNLGQESLPTGTYKGFRLVIDPSQSSITLKDGTKPNIQWPSAARTGIKVKLEQPIAVTERETLMVIDFDLAGSFVLRGNSMRNNGLLFKPVLRGIATNVAGAVAGTVRADAATGAGVPDAQVELWAALTDTATAGATALATARTDAAGAYKIVGVRQGQYAIRVVAPAAPPRFNATVPSLTITANATATADAVLMPKPAP